MIHCLKEHVHDYAMVGIVATRDKLGLLQPVAKNEQFTKEIEHYLFEKAGKDDVDFLPRNMQDIETIISRNEKELHARLAALQAEERKRAHKESKLFASDTSDEEDCSIVVVLKGEMIPSSGTKDNDEIEFLRKMSSTSNATTSSSSGKNHVKGGAKHWLY